jgi:ferredoxin
VRDAAHAGDLRVSEDGKPLLPTFLLRQLREDPEGVYGIMAGPLDREALDLLQLEQQIDPQRIRVYALDGKAERHDDREAWEAFHVPSIDAPPAERWDFWTAEFDRCVRCNACREDCPLCSCTRCIADKTRPRWIDSSASPEGNWLWNVTRALHLGGRCVECSNCESACPAGIPLVALTHHLNRVAAREWGPRVDGDQVGRSPLVVFRLEDKADFIM